MLRILNPSCFFVLCGNLAEMNMPCTSPHASKAMAYTTYIYCIFSFHAAQFLFMHALLMRTHLLLKMILAQGPSTSAWVLQCWPGHLFMKPLALCKSFWCACICFFNNSGLECQHTAMGVTTAIINSQPGKEKTYFVPHETKVCSRGSPCIKVRGTWHDHVASMANTHWSTMWLYFPYIKNTWEWGSFW